MLFHRPGTPEDLPPLDTLWAHAATTVVLEAGGRRKHSLHTLEDGYVFYDDGGGNSWRLLRLEGGRGLLIGFDHECDDIIDDDGFDVFEDGPDWLPWDWGLDLVAVEENIGFVYWWDGTVWARTPYPEYVTKDGVGWLLPQLLSVENLSGWCADRFLGRSADEARARLAESLPGVLRSAEAGELTEDVLSSVLGLLATDADLPGALELAEGLGLSPGSTHPAMPLGSGKPVRPQMIDFQHSEGWLGHGDMLRRAREHPGRPEPAPGPELERLVAWARAHRLGEDGRAVLLHDAAEARWGMRGPRPTEEESLWRALHEAETHPRYGGWLYLLLEVTEDTHTVRRAYDHWPDWLTEHVTDPMVRGLQNAFFTAWLQERDTDWLPSWIRPEPWGLQRPSLTAPEDWTRPGGPAPSYPWKPFAPGERESHLDVLRAELASATVGEWTSLRLVAHSLIGVTGVLLHVTRNDGTEERILAPRRTSPLLARLRSGMYERGTGTWYRAELVLHRDGTAEEAYDHDGEPEFGRRVRDTSYQLDFRYFPRDVAHTPDWMRARIGPPASGA